MSWSNSGTISSQKKKLSSIEKRTNTTDIPSIDRLFSSSSRKKTSKALVTNLIDQVYFSSFPPNDASIAISTLSMNSNNIHHIRQSGALGVIIEMLRRIDFNSTLDEVHIDDLIRSISILTHNNNDAQSRLLSNPYAISCILQLCIKTSGASQDQIFNVLDSLCKNNSSGSTPVNSIPILISNNIFTFLLSHELLSRPSTYLTVRHNAANLINKIATLFPHEFPIERFENILLTNDGHRSVDGYIEMQLLNAFHSHVNYLANEKIPLVGCRKILLHLINEIKDEQFEDLEHLLQILKCLMIISRETQHASYLMDNDLTIALQYVVKTDFELWRRSLETYKRPQTSASSATHGFTSSLSLSMTSSSPSSSSPSPSRPRTTSAPLTRRLTNGTQNTLNAIREIKTNKLKKQFEDINFKTTRLVVMIYEHVMRGLGIQVIGGIVSSGLISGLLFRVGKGKNIDKRFHKLVTRFIYLLLVKVATEQPPNLRPMSVVGLVPPQGQYTRAGSRRPTTATATGAAGIQRFVTMIKPKQEPTSVRLVSHKLHAQGVTDLMIVCLDGEDYEIVSDAMVSLASMHFPCIKPHVLREQTLGKICGYTLARKDCFFAGLALVCEAVLSPTADHFPGFINVLVSEFNAITILAKAMKLSGWIFSMKGNVYEALAVLSIHPKFREKLRKARAIGTLVCEIDARRRVAPTHRRGGRGDKTESPEEDISTLLLFGALKKDWAATKIQAVYRASITRRLGPSRRDSLLMWSINDTVSYVST